MVAPKAAGRGESSDGWQPGGSAGVGAMQPKVGTPAAAAAAAGKALEVTAAVVPLSGLAEDAVAGLIGPAAVEAARGWGWPLGPELCDWVTKGCTPGRGAAAAEEGGLSAGPWEGGPCCLRHWEGRPHTHLQPPGRGPGLRWEGDCAAGEGGCQQECSCSSWETWRGANRRIPEAEADAVASAGLHWRAGRGA